MKKIIRHPTSNKKKKRTKSHLFSHTTKDDEDCVMVEMDPNHSQPSNKRESFKKRVAERIQLKNQLKRLKQQKSKFRNKVLKQRKSIQEKAHLTMES
ncbi:uncharacterized protein LOC128883461 isoform X2 [Hylaeus volcanicus]|uniref:uncharacterized protein LOC128883461 isoform X2 n=1 Tax=Hylaeus volcanicus TaxID=313075 RepID=UPI0023B848E6|nr:uncharacterized protein LOC128883461 isoform X2 [Hylaeus volcanicus]